MKVRMVNSVGEYVAGEEYDLPDEQADRYVVLGYAEGDLSREYAEAERQTILGTVQEVSV